MTKFYVVLLERANCPFLKSFTTLELAYTWAKVEAQKVSAQIDLLLSVRNDLCDRDRQMYGHFLEIAKTEDGKWKAFITKQEIQTSPEQFTDNPSEGHAILKGLESEGV